MRWAVKHALGASQTDTRDSYQPQNIKDNNNKNVRKHIHQQSLAGYTANHKCLPQITLYCEHEVLIGINNT